MGLTVILVSSDESQRDEICSILQSDLYNFTQVPLLEQLETALRSRTKGVIVLDLDSVPLNNRMIRDPKRLYPQFTILGISSLSFHPGLEKALSTHILACLRKPVDGDELLFWLKAASGNAMKNSVS